MALENIVGSNVGRRWIMTFSFGLIHGFGFSFALRESLQFAGDHLVTSLLAFNLGVEIGQLAVLLVLRRPLLPRKGMGLLVFRGLAGFGGIACLFYGAIHLPLAVATLLNWCSLLFVIVFSGVFLKERIPGGTAGWIGLSVLGLLLLVSFRAAQMSVGAVQAVYWAVTALMGVSLSLVLFRYTGASVARTFFVTAAAFGALSLYGYTTKKDLSAFGKFLFMGVIGLVLASLVNMFWPSGTMSFIISVVGVLVFSGLIAYDTQKIKEQYSEAYGTDVMEKVAIFGALSLYLDFVNLFQFLMSFFGQQRD